MIGSNFIILAGEKIISVIVKGDGVILYDK